MIMELLKSVLRILVVILMPVALVFGGGALAGLGISNDLGFLVWGGLALVGAGIIWGVVLYMGSGASFWD